MNTPRVGNGRGERISTEACGTSWEKDILGNTILISTPDGGAADLEVRAEQGKTEEKPPYLEISGMNFGEEVNSLYKQMAQAADLLDDKEEKIKYLKRQLAAYLPIISGARMEEDYLSLI